MTDYIYAMEFQNQVVNRMAVENVNEIQWVILIYVSLYYNI